MNQYNKEKERDIRISKCEYEMLKKKTKALEIIKEALDNHGCAVIQYGFVDIKGSIYNDEKVKLLKEVLYE